MSINVIRTKNKAPQSDANGTAGSHLPPQAEQHPFGPLSVAKKKLDQSCKQASSIGQQKTTGSKNPSDVALTARRPERRRREPKTERMDIRVTPTVKEFVQEVMDATGWTAGDLMLEGARALSRDLQTNVEERQPEYRSVRIRPRPGA